MQQWVRSTSAGFTRRTLLQAGTALGFSPMPFMRVGQQQEQAACFDKASNTRLNGGLRVFRPAPPPIDDNVDDGYLYWPCTDAANQSNAVARSTWSGNSWHFVWANRWNGGHNQKPNPIYPRIVTGPDDFDCRVEYTSIAKASAATRSFIRYTLGYDASDVAEP